MSKLKIAIVAWKALPVYARFRPRKPAQWIRDIAAERDDMGIEIVDLPRFRRPSSTR